MSGQWVLVDTMVAEPSVVMVDGVPPETFRKALRVLSQLDRRSAPLLLGMVQRSVQEQRPIEWAGDSGNKIIHLAARPAVSHDGEVWAVWAWFGTAAPASIPPSAGAFMWDQVVRLAYPTRAALSLLDLNRPRFPAASF